MNPFQAFNNANLIMQQFNMMRNNPKEINKLLLNSGKISQEQYEAIKDMDPAQTGQYLLNNGVINRSQIDQLAQVVPQIRQMIGS